jgi:mono/diheme cytochrome c family protein
MQPSPARTTRASHRSLLIIGFVALVLAGCRGRHAETSASRIHQGAALFEHACAGCHSLNAATSTAIGGDLARPVLTLPDLVSLERIMPVKLTNTQLYAVALYVHAIETKAKAHPRP